MKWLLIEEQNADHLLRHVRGEIQPGISLFRLLIFLNEHWLMRNGSINYWDELSHFDAINSVILHAVWLEKGSLSVGNLFACHACVSSDWFMYWTQALVLKLILNPYTPEFAIWRVKTINYHMPPDIQIDLESEWLDRLPNVWCRFPPRPLPTPASWS
jgi:hypothetical protein